MKSLQQTDLKKKLSHLIVCDALAEQDGELILKRAAELIGITPSGLHYNIRGKKKWSIETWLAMLAILGKVEVVDNDKIVIHTRQAKKLKSIMRELPDTQVE